MELRNTLIHRDAAVSCQIKPGDSDNEHDWTEQENQNNSGYMSNYLGARTSLAAVTTTNRVQGSPPLSA
jgi:hypothetical protein